VKRSELRSNSTWRRRCGLGSGPRGNPGAAQCGKVRLPTQAITYIAQINKETSKNGVQLFVVKNPRQADTGVGMEVDKMEVAFRQRTPHDKKLVISVRANGEAHVSISTSSVSQAQQYMLNVLEVTNE
jgi:hypothetical protein